MKTSFALAALLALSATAAQAEARFPDQHVHRRSCAATPTSRSSMLGRPRSSSRAGGFAGLTSRLAEVSENTRSTAPCRSAP